MSRRPLVLTLACALVPVGCWVERIPESERQQSAAEVQRAVAAMLDSSRIAWNDGDLTGFMNSYARLPSTTYVGAAGLLEGFDAIEARYALLFQPGARRDSLRFEDLRVRRLSTVLALATARWVLYGEDGTTTASGPFTLVLHRMGKEWRIIHDHSSSDPAPARP